MRLISSWWIVRFRYESSGRGSQRASDRILVANDPFQIDLQAIFFGHIEDGLYGKGSNSRVFPCICPKSSYIWAVSPLVRLWKPIMYR